MREMRVVRASQARDAEGADRGIVGVWRGIGCGFAGGFGEGVTCSEPGGGGEFDGADEFVGLGRNGDRRRNRNSGARCRGDGFWVGGHQKGIGPRRDFQRAGRRLKRPMPWLMQVMRNSRETLAGRSRRMTCGVVSLMKRRRSSKVGGGLGVKGVGDVFGDGEAVLSNADEFDFGGSGEGAWTDVEPVFLDGIDSDDGEADGHLVWGPLSGWEHRRDADATLVDALARFGARCRGEDEDFVGGAVVWGGGADHAFGGAEGAAFSHGAGGEVGAEDDEAAGEGVGGVRFFDAGEDSAGSEGAGVEGEFEEFIGFFDGFGGEDFSYA